MIAPWDVPTNIKATHPSKEIAVTSERDQLYFDVFTTAMEGGIGYWSEAASYHIGVGDDEDNPHASYTEDVLGFYAVVIEIGDGDCEEEHRIDRSVIVKGMNRLASDKRYCNDDLQRALRRAYRNPADEDIDIDAEGADVIVQVGLFDDVRYG